MRVQHLLLLKRLHLFLRRRILHLHQLQFSTQARVVEPHRVTARPIEQQIWRQLLHRLSSAVKLLTSSAASSPGHFGKWPVIQRPIHRPKDLSSVLCRARYTTTGTTCLFHRPQHLERLNCLCVTRLTGPRQAYPTIAARSTRRSPCPTLPPPAPPSC